MSYSITSVEGEPIFIITFRQDFNFATDLEKLAADLRTHLDPVAGKAVLINDIQGITLGLDPIIQAANVARQRDVSLFHHPKVGGIAVISTSSLIQLTAKGLNTATFGNLTMPVFGTQDEAVSYARQLIGQWQEA